MTFRLQVAGCAQGYALGLGIDSHRGHPFVTSDPRIAAGPRRDRQISAVSEVVVRHRIAALLAVDASAALARIQLPILVLQAGRDLVIPRSATRWILETAPHAQLIEIDGPHLLLQTRPVECAAAVSKFVRTVI